MHEHEKGAPAWPHAKAADLFYIKGRLGWKGLRAAEFRDDGPFLITGTDFRDGKVRWDCSFHVSEERFSESPEIAVRKDDILITKDGTVGKVAYINDVPPPGKASLNSHLFLVRTDPTRVHPRFAYYVFESDVFGRFVDAKQTGSTRIGLPQRVFESFDFPLPHLGEQAEIATILSAVDAEIERTNLLVKKYQQIKAGLMHDLLTQGISPDGRLRSGSDCVRLPYG
jgi:type I restriction enzyme S subunit